MQMNNFLGGISDGLDQVMGMALQSIDSVMNVVTEVGTNLLGAATAVIGGRMMVDGMDGEGQDAGKHITNAAVGASAVESIQNGVGQFTDNIKNQVSTVLDGLPSVDVQLTMNGSPNLDQNDIQLQGGVPDQVRNAASNLELGN